MRLHRLVRQTAFLSGSHFVVRIMGFSLRVWLSRELGAQAMGLVELTHSAQSLLIAPVASGLPAAVSRLSAQRGRTGGARVALVGAGLSLLVSIPVAAAAFCLREPLARWLGDIRTLPALCVCCPVCP
ncbi:MAG: oligosaccharide flippase family protein [Candidatus Ventricola sp.]|nr:oligosaccharide flippase family protein [Candidatus Ventricola sp.]